MKIDDMRESSNVEEQSGGGRSFGGGGIRLGGGALVLIIIVSVLFGINPMTLIGGLESVAPPAGQPAPGQPPPGYGPQAGKAGPGTPADPSRQLAARVLGDTEDVWGAVFQTMGKTYPPPTL
ncbi:MAG: neutral zinc metallopeptidase, partial [Casimicrobiaceae bacterium]